METIYLFIKKQENAYFQSLSAKNGCFIISYSEILSCGCKLAWIVEAV